MNSERGDTIQPIPITLPTLHFCSLRAVSFRRSLCLRLFLQRNSGYSMFCSICVTTQEKGFIESLVKKAIYTMLNLLNKKSISVTQDFMLTVLLNKTDMTLVALFKCRREILSCQLQHQYTNPLFCYFTQPK